jgi:hypothetical protein
MDTKTIWISLYVAAGILMINGCAGWLGNLISKKYTNNTLAKYSSDIIRIAAGLILVIIAAVAISISLVD